nr:MAG TPA: hypothetical protein [Bacteriophage sp.]
MLFYNYNILIALFQRFLQLKQKSSPINELPVSRDLIGQLIFVIVSNLNQCPIAFPYLSTLS